MAGNPTQATGIIQSHSRLEHDVGLAPHEVEERDARVEFLTGHFLNIARGDHTAGTIEYIRSGGNLRLCLTEIMALSEPCEEDRRVREARGAYMGQALQRKGLKHRWERKRQLRESEEAYVDVVVEKIAAVIDASTPEDALALGQMPTLIEKASFRDDEVSESDLAANHLYILIDTALKEHVHRRHAVERGHRRSRLGRIAGNRMLHMAVAGGVFAASISPRLGMLPTHGEHTAETIEDGLKILSGTILGLSMPEAFRMKYMQVRNDRRTRELCQRLAEDRDLADRALSMTYNSTRCGTEDAPGRVTGRSGTDDKEENLKRFARLDREFPHLNNDPGGKPYTGDQALGYAARMLIERQHEIDAIVAGGKTAAERRELFLELSRAVIVEDVIRMKKGLNVSRVRRRIANFVAIVPAILYPQAASTANEATTLSRETAGKIAGGETAESEAQQ